MRRDRQATSTPLSVLRLRSGVRAKQAPTDSVLDESQNLFSLTRFSFGELRAELHRGQSILSIFKARLHPLYSPGGVL
jgi:hypothetical protein